MGIGGNEKDVQLPGEQALRILLAEVGRVGDVMAELLAPDRHHLGHDAGVVPPEPRAVEASAPILPDRVADKLDDPDP